MSAHMFSVRARIDCGRGATLASRTLLTVALSANAARAQDRLLGLRAVGAGVSGEAISFGDGVWQTPTPGQDSIRVRRASQISIPVTTAIPIGQSLTFDATAVYGHGQVRYSSVGPGGVQRDHTATLTGISDVRLRLTARFLGDRIVFTAGGNIPSGRTSLDSAQLVAVRVLAAPAVGFSSPPIGSGPSGTVGVLAAQNVGQWAVAAGASYERRGTYAPVTALIAGLTSLDFTPGDVLRLSLGGDGLVARGRLSASVSADFYQRDRLRGGGVLGVPGGTSTTTSPATATLATVQLGPVISSDVQYNAPAPKVRELVFYGSLQRRTPYARDGVLLRNTATNYANAGVRTAAPLAPGRDLFVAGDLRYSSGIPTGGGLTTTFYTAGAVTGGLSQRLGGRLTAQPYVRVQAGRVVGRGEDRGHDGVFRGGAVGLTFLSRF